MKYLRPFLFLCVFVGQINIAIGTGLQVHNASFVPDAILRITQQNISKSCVPAKPTVIVNGTSPGPEIRLLEGKTYWIRVYNDMQQENLTMHWHGLSMAVSPFSDGTPQASQWPIPPMHFFDYEINVPVGMAGTYFYHSHVGFQAVSANGPLIVEDSQPPPFEYDEDKIIFVQDLFENDDATIVAGLTSPNFAWSGETSSILINDQGGGTANGTVCNSSLSFIDVDPGKTYRLRFVGSTALNLISLGFEDHDTLTVIEADGSYTQPHNTSFLQFGTGQRYSVLLCTKTAEQIKNKTQFYMQVESRERPTLTQSFAILNYGPKVQKEAYPPSTPPFTLPPTKLDFLDYELSPFDMSSDFPTASEVTRQVTLNVAQLTNNNYITWDIDNVNWTESYPTEPYLVTLYKNDTASFPSMSRALANGGLDNVTRSFPAEIGEVLEIVIENGVYPTGDLDIHPFHFHGSHFWDLGGGNGSYDAVANERKWNASAGKPVKRDTTVLYRYSDIEAANATVGTLGWRAWRTRVTEPGVWMLHCHTLQHMVMGMQTVWVLGNETEVLKLPRPEVEGYLTYGGDVYGNESHWPSVVHYQDTQGADE